MQISDSVFPHMHFPEPYRRLPSLQNFDLRERKLIRSFQTDVTYHVQASARFVVIRLKADISRRSVPGSPHIPFSGTVKQFFHIWHVL